MAINAKSSQEFVPIKEVRNGIIVLKDGSLRAVLLASSLNLSLKSSDEQIAIINEFQNFLNSLDFTVQICIQSRRLDIRPYLLTLENRMKDQVEPLLKIQTKEYMDFIRTFTEEVNIMTKNFFIVVPYTETIIKSAKILDDLLGGKGKTIKIGDSKNKSKEMSELISFEEKRTQLDQRIGVVISGLGRMGIRTTQLKTDQVVELFYKTFNPGDISQGIKIE
jgi:hypothetical protein